MPSPQELEASGFTLEDFASDPVDCLPDNEQAYLLFEALSTQWRVGAGGPTGLDYNIMYRMMDRMRLSDEDYQLVELDLQILESHALAEMHRK